MNMNLRDYKSTIDQLSNIVRAERNESSKYLEIYAKKETISSIDNIQNQVIYGRRGTGKTHLLKAFEEELNNKFIDEKKFSVYIDLRKLLPLISSSNNDPVEFSIIIFKYVIQEIIDCVIQNIKFIFGRNLYKPEDSYVLGKRAELTTLLPKLNYEFDGKEYKKLQNFDLSEDELKKISGSLKINKSPELSFDGQKEMAIKKVTNQSTYISFSEIANIISEIPSIFYLKNIVCLLDEWSEIPVESQPYLAELLKRVFITSTYVFKIAAIPNRTKLGINTDSKYFGFEDGGDIFGFSLDDRYIFEINKQDTRDFFNELLFKHLSSINDQFTVLYYDENTQMAKNSFINDIFANQALREILIASAGIPRDFINIFINSYNKFYPNASSTNKRIGVKHVRLGTIAWYQTDKKKQIDNDPYCKLLLEKIKDEVVVKRKKTHFLIPEKHHNDYYIQKLIDLRAIHLRKKGYSHKGNKGVSYNVYSVDYGCYTSLNIYQSNLDTGLLSTIESIDNFRDIRRVSLEDDFFNNFSLEVGDSFNCPKCGKPVDTKHPAYIKQGLCNHCFEKID